MCVRDCVCVCVSVCVCVCVCVHVWVSGCILESRTDTLGQDADFGEADFPETKFLNSRDWVQKSGHSRITNFQESRKD